MARTPQEEIVHFISDLYSMELQAAVQMAKAPDLARDPTLAEFFRSHCAETEDHAERVRARLESLGGSSSAIKDMIMKLGGKAFLLFAKVLPETPGRLVAHAYSYEAMEWAGYEVLIRMAELAGDEESARLGRAIQAQEHAMMRRLESGFDAAEEASHRNTPVDELATHVCKHLAEAHALESQSVQQMKKSADIAGSPELARIYKQHEDESHAQMERIERRLEALGGDTSLLEDAALKLGAIEWGMFFQSQSDTPAKLAAFGYAVEHLEIAGYELLKRSARRAGDAETERLADALCAEEKAMAERLENSLDLSVRATLEAVRR